MFINLVCFSAKVYDYNYFSKADDEGMHYILQIEKFYDLLWNSSSPALKKYSLTQSNNDKIAINKYNFKQIEINGFLVTQFAEAQKQGLFKLFNKAFKAKKQTYLNILEPPVEDYKLICPLHMVRYLYTYKILQNAEHKKWNLVIEDVKAWLNLGILCKAYRYSKPVLITMFALLQKYNLPVDAIKEIIAMNELIISNPPKNERAISNPPKKHKRTQQDKEQAINLSILNITVANLLLYEKEKSALPDKLSQLKYLKPFLAKQTKKIIYKKNGLNWTLYYKAEAINKGKQVIPFRGFLFAPGTDHLKKSFPTDPETTSPVPISDGSMFSAEDIRRSRQSNTGHRSGST